MDVLADLAAVIVRLPERLEDLKNLKEAESRKSEILDNQMENKPSGLWIF